MSADVLRRAAELMRERAAEANPGPWRSYVEGRDHFAGDDFIQSPDEDIYVEVRVMQPWNPKHAADQDHIASWHPAVALAVADWLDAEADLSEQVAEVMGRVRTARTVLPPARVVALAYLGES